MISTTQTAPNMAAMNMAERREVAAKYIQAGLCAIPAGRQKKYPLCDWKAFQSRLPVIHELRFTAATDAIAIVCGPISGNLEVIDFDQQAIAFDQWAAIIEVDLLNRLAISTTQSGGKHVLYRCESPVAGNQKLASRFDADTGELQTLIETRGQGGLVIAAPTAGYEITQGDLCQLPTITKTERKTLLQAAKSLCEIPEAQSPQRMPERSPQASQGDTNRPGDIFNSRGDIGELLSRHGWIFSHNVGRNQHWTRPGKDGGTSATWDGKHFYVFSSNAAPFEPSESYRPFKMLSLLDHGGDDSQAARALQVEGYGQKSPINDGTDIRGIIGAESPQSCPTKEPEAKKTLTRPVLERMSDIESKPVNWLWRDRLALGKITILAGDPGLGKSFSTIDIAARVSTGAPWPGGDTQREPGGTIIISAEDDLADTIRPRLDAAGADVSRVFAMSAVALNCGTGEQERLLNLGIDLEPLRAAIEQVDNCQLLIIDPISAFLGGTDAHKNAEVRGVLVGLVKLAEQHNIAVLMVNHLRKGDGQAIYRSMGSIAFTAVARIGLSVSRDRADETGQRRLFLPIKNNIGDDHTGLAYSIQQRDPDNEQSAYVDWESGTVSTSAEDAIGLGGTARPGPEPTSRLEAENWLRSLLEGGKMLRTDVKHSADGEDFSWATVRRAKKAIGAESTQIGGQWYWLIPGASLYSNSRYTEN